MPEPILAAFNKTSVNNTIQDEDLRKSDYTPDDVWRAIGKILTPIARRIIVRTDPPPKMTEGGLHIPDSVASLRYGLPHMHIAKASVLSVNQKTGIQPMDRVFFKMTYFILLVELPDGSNVGSVLERNLEMATREMSQGSYTYVGPFKGR